MIGLRKLGFLLLGVAACSSSVIFIRQSTTEPVLLSGLRLLVAVLVLSVPFVRAWKRHRDVYTWRSLARSVLPGALLAAHFVTWIQGARLTPAVNSSTIVNMVPVVTPLLLWAIAHERPNLREWLGTLLALGGVLFMIGGDYRFAPENVTGDVLCFGSMLLFAAYLVFGRRNRDAQSLWLYLVPLYATAALLCLAAAPFVTNGQAPSFDTKELLLILGLGLVPTVIGHTALNHAMKHLRGQIVSVVNLGQPFFAGFLGYLFLAEVPAWFFYPASVMIVFGAVLAVWQPSRSESSAVVGRDLKTGPKSLR
ncbi:MAG: hypothetical protein RJA70_218 [Pseudomonadota bacterium]|jgi:drug/metabolite transporter (DMT)-like permease